MFGEGPQESAASVCCWRSPIVSWCVSLSFPCAFLLSALFFSRQSALFILQALCSWPDAALACRILLKMSPGVLFFPSLCGSGVGVDGCNNSIPRENTQRNHCQYSHHGQRNLRFRTSLPCSPKVLNQTCFSTLLLRRACARWYSPHQPGAYGLPGERERRRESLGFMKLSV